MKILTEGEKLSLQKKIIEIGKLFRAKEKELVKLQREVTQLGVDYSDLQSEYTKKYSK